MAWEDETQILSAGWVSYCSAWFESLQQKYVEMFETEIFLELGISNLFFVLGFVAFLIDHRYWGKQLHQ